MEDSIQNSRPVESTKRNCTNCGTSILDRTYRKYDSECAVCANGLKEERNARRKKYLSGSAPHSPQFLRAWVNEGNSLGDSGNHEEALSAYEIALGLDPKFPKAWMCKGNSLSALNRYEEAFEAYDIALKIDPGYDVAWFNKGMLLSKVDRYSEAIHAFDSALGINPKYSRALYHKGISLVEFEQQEEALDAFDEALKIHPQFFQALDKKREILMDLGRVEEAFAASMRSGHIKDGIRRIQSLVESGDHIPNEHISKVGDQRKKIGSDKASERLSNEQKRSSFRPGNYSRNNNSWFLVTGLVLFLILVNWLCNKI